ncbi:MAG: hypothetical protein Q4G27_00870 [Flavobacteriaceae bacterium]|nr:hypothetical protein [Flavobacteriaceae bacterium]
MKKLSFILFLMAGLSLGQTVEEEISDQSLNEITLNLPVSIFAEFPMVSYERLINADMGIGASVGFGTGSEFIEDATFMLSPFARWYFTGISPREAFGRKFFVEANGAMIGFKDNEEVEYYINEKTGGISFGLGLGIGYKYVNRSNWVATLVLGGGRIFSSKNSVEAYPAMGINIGKRF